MDLRQMRQFVVLAEHLHFRRAAEQLNMSQPPLTAAIQRLEAGLGVSLLERSRQRVALTPAGKVFLERARRLLQQVDEAVEVTQNAARGNTGHLQLSCVPSALIDRLPSYMGEFHRLYPGVAITLTEALSAQQLEDIRQERIDVGILIPRAPEQYPELEMAHLREEQFVLACPSSHRLAKRRTARVRDIRNEPLVFFMRVAESPVYSGVILREFELANFQPKVEHNFSKWNSSLVMVAAGFGLAIVPRPMSALHITGLSFVPLVREDGQPITYPISIALRRDSMNPAAQNFLRLVLEH